MNEDDTTPERPGESPPSLGAGASASQAPPLIRVCRKCSVQSQGPGSFCPSCGTSYAGRKGPSRKAVLIGAVVALLLIGSVVGGILVKKHNDDVAADKRAAAAEEADRIAEEEAAADAAAEVEAQEAADEEIRSERRDLVKFLQRAITKDARKAVADGILDGPILHTFCTATGGGSEDDLTALTGTFECLAVTEKNNDGTESGYGYQGTTEWETGQVTWRLGNG